MSFQSKVISQKSVSELFQVLKTFESIFRADDRNFRSHYYEKVGFRGMDERKTLDSILKDDPISLEKCVNFALRCTIPANDRYLLRVY